MASVIDLYNEYYRRKPPEIVFDDLGVYHDYEVPLPGKYKREPCKCGIIHKWESPETFIIEDFELFVGIFKKIKRCKSCKDALHLKLVDKDGQ